MSCCWRFNPLISGALRPFLFRKSAKFRRSYALRSAEIFPVLGRILGQGLSSKTEPHRKRHLFIQNLYTPGLNDPQDIPKNTVRYLEIIVIQQTLPDFRDPNLCGVSRRRTLCYMDVNRPQGTIFICPEVRPVGSNLKDLRHVQSLPTGKIQRSDGR